MLLPVGAAVLCLGVCLPLFKYYQKSLRPVLGALYKTLGTCCALVVALVAALRLDSFCFLCVAALAIHAAADYTLEFSFPLGAGLFMAGHICYIAFFMHYFPLSGAQILCLIGFLTFTGLMLYRWRKAAGKQLLLFAVYGVVLCSISACVIGGGILSHTSQGIMAAGAGALLFLSDSLLCYRLLYPTGRIMGWSIMVTYYLAELLFATSCLLI